MFVCLFVAIIVGINYIVPWEEFFYLNLKLRKASYWPRGKVKLSQKRERKQEAWNARPCAAKFKIALTAAINDKPV